MTSIERLLGDLDTTTADLVHTQPAADQARPIVDAWPALADAAAHTLLKVPTLDGHDDPGLFRALVDLARRPGGDSPVLASQAQAYRAIGVHLDGQARAAGLDVLHARLLQDRLLQPLNALAEWSGYYAWHAAPGLRPVFDELARSTRTRPPTLGTRYGDLGGLDPQADDRILRAAAVWASDVTASLQPPHVSTSGLRATLGDLNITLATAYYLTKAAMLTRQVDPAIGTGAVSALWDARNEWRIQARQFPRDLRLGELISTDRNALAADLRDTLKDAFQEPSGEWLPARDLLATFGAADLLRYARSLAEVSHQVGGQYLTAVRVLPTLAVVRHDPTYKPVFPVGTDLAKVRRDRWLPVSRTDPELVQLGVRAGLAVSETSRALDAVRDTALDSPTNPASAARPVLLPVVPRRDLLQVIAALDAMMPATKHKYGHVNPGSRPAWASGRTPPESIPDPPRGRPGQPHLVAPATRTRATSRGIRP